MAHQRATGVTPPELDVPPVPAGMEAVWQAFRELHQARGGGMGPAPITFPDLLAWQQVNRVALTPWEVETIQAIDAAALEELAGTK